MPDLLETMSNLPPPPPHELPGHQQPYVAPPGHLYQPKSGWSGCLIGCLVAFGLCCLLCAGVGVYVSLHFKGWATNLARQAIAAGIEQSGLPQQEKDAILAQVDRVAVAYEEGEITTEELGEIMQELAESPIMGLAMVKGIEAKFLEPSGLSEEEKEDAKRTIARVLRGAIEEKIDQQEIEQLSNHFLKNPPNGDPQAPKELKDRMTDEELRRLLTEAKELVDIKEIPDEEYDFKFSEKIREIVDEALR